MVQIFELDEYCLVNNAESEEMTEFRNRLLDNLSDLSDLKISHYNQLVDSEVKSDEPVQWIENQQVDEIAFEDQTQPDRNVVEVAYQVQPERSVVEAVHQAQSDSNIETENSVEEQSDSLVEHNSMNSREKQLFGQFKDDIYSGASGVINAHEKEPYFLIQLFRGVAKLDSVYLRQRLLLALDDIMIERKADLED